MSKKAADKGKMKVKEEQPGLEQQRLTKLLVEAFDRAPEQVRPYLRQAAPAIATLWTYFLVALPYLARAFVAVQAFMARMPEKVVYASIGFIVCFFGGIFPATIAAVEAFLLCGGRESLACINELYVEFQKLQAANKKDDKKDDDHNGVADVDQLLAKDLLMRKANLAFQSVDPERVSSGVVGLYTGWVGVLAILKIRFARTVTLGEAIGKQISKPASRLQPMLEDMLPQEYKRWAPVIIRWTCKTIAISISWWIERVIAAVHSAIRGGHLFGKHLVDHLQEAGVLPKGPDQTNREEAIAWGIAFLGVMFQFSMGFALPFPLNILLFPIRLVESFIAWTQVWSVAMAPL